MERSEASRYGVFLGVDVGKSSNYAVAVQRESDAPFLSCPVRQDEADIRRVIAEAARHGEVLLVVDQFGAFGRLVVAVAKDAGVDVAQMPPRKFKQVAETYGEDKSDSRDALILADASRSQPRLVTIVGDRADAIAEIKVVAAARDDLVKERTRCYNRLHDLVQQACPALEAVLTKRKLHNDLELRLLARYGGPIGLRKAGRARCARWAGSIKYQSVRGPAKVDELFCAISRQTIDLPGANAVEAQIKRVASRVIELEAEVGQLDAELRRLSAFVPEVELLRSVSGVGEVFGAVIAAEIGDVGRFEDAGHLASYGGIAPCKEESGTSVRKKKNRKGGNRRLKNALLRSAEASLMTGDPRAKAYYDRKRAEGKKHRQAIRALARRRVDVIYAILRDGTLYEPSHVAE